MRKLNAIAGMVAAALLFFPAGILAQDKPDKDKQETAVDHGSVDLGLRYSWGDVYGRPDLQSGQCLGCGTPFDPNLKNSKFGEYRDMRNGLYLRRIDLRFENVLNSKNYVSLKSQRTLYRDQSYLATFGQYGKFKIQFRYDEIPHTYSDTTRTLFTQTSLGVWRFPTLIRQSLQAATGATLPNIINTQVVPQSNFITPSIIRKAGTALVSYNVTPAWLLNLSFWRESQRGTRPIGLIMNSSPSASTTGGFGVELPETINYFNNLLRFGTEYGKRSWGIQAAYIGSFFENNTGQLLWDNPFRTTDCFAPGVAPNTCTSATQGPATGRMDLYPDNRAQYLSFAGATDVTKYMRFTASITPGWLRQDDLFLPYTTNTAINTCGTGTQACTSLLVLPAPSLSGAKQTLAMNYTLVTTAWKNFEFKTNYRQYDYNNNTPVLSFTPVEGDAAAPTAPNENTPFGFNRKNVEVTGIWYFAKKSSLKAGYEGEWMDRSHRDVAHSMENSLFVAGDWVPFKDFLVRLSYRHSDRKPDVYQDDNATDPVSGADVTCADTTTTSFTADQRCNRRFDEAARLLNRGDALVQYSPSDKLTVSVFGGTLQNNFNRPGGSNSPVPLNFLTGAAATTSPYYLYGVLKDISYNYGFDTDYALSPSVSLFAEYSHERYYKRIISRNRTPLSGVQTILNCTNGCDSANNDWESVTKEPVDIYSAGVDLYLGKKTYFTTYYSLSAAKGHVDTRPLGDSTIVAAGPNLFTLNGTNSATNYPETVNRIHEIAVILKYKLRENLTPKIEYRYQQWDNKDYQTSAMTQYMGCVSPIPNGPPVTNAIAGCTTPFLTTNTINPVGVASPFYPYFVVGDTSAARYLFLGVDQPSYRAHILTASLEYRF